MISVISEPGPQFKGVSKNSPKVQEGFNFFYILVFISDLTMNFLEEEDIFLPGLDN